MEGPPRPVRILPTTTARMESTTGRTDGENIRDTFVWTVTIGTRQLTTSPSSPFHSILSSLIPFFSPPLFSSSYPSSLFLPSSPLLFSLPLSPLFLPSSPLLFSPPLLLPPFLRRYDLSSSSGDSSPEHPSISKRPSYRPPSAAAPSTRGKKPLDTSPYYSGYNSSEEYDGSRRPYLDLEVHF